MEETTDLLTRNMGRGPSCALRITHSLLVAIPGADRGFPLSGKYVSSEDEAEQGSIHTQRYLHLIGKGNKLERGGVCWIVDQALKNPLKMRFVVCTAEVS